MAFAGSFWDIPGKTHRARWQLDGLSATGTVVEPTATKAGIVKGSYVFAAAGVYATRMEVIDESGTVGIADSVDGVNSLVVVYDPSGGYVTGGGWFESPRGALAATPDLTGRVNFGLVSKYFKNAKAPKGETSSASAPQDSISTPSTSTIW